jgi:hypothetical protein
MCQIVGSKHKPKAMGFDYCGDRRHYRTRRRRLSAGTMDRYKRGQETKLPKPCTADAAPIISHRHSIDTGAASLETDPNADPVVDGTGT